ncbi:MAG: hypothetical protein NTW86_10815 [Candidatus Sumerlaeota bacterium]|nr:hypothetical protein [Candidatus Sumerlaeota bacterium]
MGAGRGRRSPKSGQSNYFVGFKKHTISGVVRWQGRWRVIPLYSQAHGAQVADVDRRLSLVEGVCDGFPGIWPVACVLGDRGYISEAHARRLREQRQIALLLHPRKDMKPPAGTDVEGCPACPCGERLIWEDYDVQDGVLIYRGDPAVCRRCPLAGTCPRQFEFDAGQSEVFWGMVPHHSQLARQLLRAFRPRIEPGFHTAKNQHRLKDFFINSQPLAETLCIISDIVETLDLLADLEAEHPRMTKNTLQQEIQQLELWG